MSAHTIHRSALDSKVLRLLEGGEEGPRPGRRRRSDRKGARGVGTRGRGRGQRRTARVHPSARHGRPPRVCAAAPNLPAGYNDAIHGVEIGEAVGSCGTAAYRGEAVFVTDIATDPLWSSVVDLPLAHGLHACWSIPIRGADGRLLGTFGNYYHELAEPHGRRPRGDRSCHSYGCARHRAPSVRSGPA